MKVVNHTSSPLPTSCITAPPPPPPRLSQGDVINIDIRKVLTKEDKKEKQSIKWTNPIGCNLFFSFDPAHLFPLPPPKKKSTKPSCFFKLKPKRKRFYFTFLCVSAIGGGGAQHQTCDEGITDFGAPQALPPHPPPKKKKKKTEHVIAKSI